MSTATTRGEAPFERFLPWNLPGLLFPRRAARKKARAARAEAELLLAANRDLFPADLSADLAAAAARLKAAPRRERTAADLAAAVAAENPVLERARAAAPKRVAPGLTALVETLVVAFGVAMPFRAYFLQPFKIPTGSMQPTLYGRHSEKADEPGFFDHAPLSWAKWLLTGRTWVDVVAHENGTLSRRYDRENDPGLFILSVAGETYKIPSDACERGEIVPVRFGTGPIAADNPLAAHLAAQARRVRKGERLWSGYVVSGDQVFVNRLLWNLRPPKRDEIVVFATGGRAVCTAPAAVAADAAGPVRATRIPFFGLSLYAVDTPIPGLPPAEHYIKRLVGLPGETISIEHPRLLVDGKPAEGSFGIDREAAMGPSESGPAYAGYHNVHDDGMPPTDPRLPPPYLGAASDSVALGDEYLPMGDNTKNSFDGRYWGPVPRRQMLGPACCVYWPLSVRWGRVR